MNAGSGSRYKNKLNIMMPTTNANVIPILNSISRIPLNIKSVLSLVYRSVKNVCPFAYLQYGFDRLKNLAKSEATLLQLCCESYGRASCFRLGLRNISLLRKAEAYLTWVA